MARGVSDGFNRATVGITQDSVLTVLIAERLDKKGLLTSYSTLRDPTGAVGRLGRVDRFGLNRKRLN